MRRLSKYLYTILALFIAFTTIAATPPNINRIKPSNSLKKFEPSQGRLFIIGQDVGSVLEYNAATSPVIPAGFAGYSSVKDNRGIIYPLAAANQWIDDMAPQDSLPIQWVGYFPDKYSNTVLQLALWMDWVNVFDDVKDGVYDSKIQELGNWLKTINIPVYLRIGFEFDNEWNGANTNVTDVAEKRIRAGKFIEAYRHVVNKLREEGVTNVAYVWHSYAMKHSLPNPPGLDGWQGVMEWYPGDNYVDWFAVSFFHYDANFSISARDWVAQNARIRQKPLMIAESAPVKGWGVTEDIHSPTIWNSWFVHYFDYIRQNNVKLISYISVDWDKIPQFEALGWGDSRVQSEPAILSNWQAELGSGNYLFSSPDLYSEIRY